MKTNCYLGYKINMKIIQMLKNLIRDPRMTAIETVIYRKHTTLKRLYAPKDARLVELLMTIYYIIVNFKQVAATYI